MSQAPTPPSLTEDDNGTPRAVARSEGRGRAVLKTRSRVLATHAVALAAAQLVLGGCPEQGAQGEAQPSSPVQTSQHHAGWGAAPPPSPAAAAEAAWALLRCQGPPWHGLEWVSQEAGVPCGPRRGGSPGSLCPRPSTATVRGALSDTQTGGSGDSGRPASSCWAGTQRGARPKGARAPPLKEGGRAGPAQGASPGRDPRRSSARTGGHCPAVLGPRETATASRKSPRPTPGRGGATTASPGQVPRSIRAKPLAPWTRSGRPPPPGRRGAWRWQEASTRPR